MSNTPVKSFASELRIPPSQNQYIKKGLREAIADLLEGQEQENQRLIESEKRTKANLEHLKTVLASQTTLLASEKQQLVEIQEAMAKENANLLSSLEEKKKEQEAIRSQLHGTLRTTSVLIEFCEENRMQARSFFESSFGVQIDKDSFKKVLETVQLNIKDQTEQNQKWSLDDMFKSLMIGGINDKEALPPPSPLSAPKPIGDPTVGDEPVEK
jgi:hypothetical protein